MIIIFTYILRSLKVDTLDLLATKKYHQKIYYKMSKAIFKVPTPVNENVKEYKKDSKELKSHFSTNTMKCIRKKLMYL